MPEIRQGEMPGEADLVIAGSTLAAISLAAQASEAGLERIVIITEGPVLLPAPTDHLQVDLVDGPVTDAITDDGKAVVSTARGTITAPAAAVVVVGGGAGSIPLDVPDSLKHRVHGGTPPTPPADGDVLVAGKGEAAADLAIRLSSQGIGVVLALGAADPGTLSRLARRTLLLKEAERRLTILWHSWPIAIEDIDGCPMVTFDDAGTPDLQFDHIIFAPEGPSPATTVPASDRVWLIGGSGEAIAPGYAWEAVRAAAFPEVAASPRRPHAWRSDDRSAIEELRNTHYNATITHFDRAHSDLWVLRVRPDHGDVSHHAGQYASLGIGYWEPRADGARDPGLDHKWDKLIRRSYSISSPIFDDAGYLVDPGTTDTLEFYIVLVPPTASRIPALTPRLALCGPSDRIYVGPRVVGRYTLAPVADPDSTVVLLSTGTGEAPHNAMAAELLRKGHTGPIVSVVSVRYANDLGYLATHRRLEERWPNYHYLPLVTRDPDQPKRYVQDVIREDVITDALGIELDPKRTHVYLCGNPSMIGIPTWDDDRPRFPDQPGACQLLFERGFDIDRRGHVGNVHSEKYW